MMRQRLWCVVAGCGLIGVAAVLAMGAAQAQNLAQEKGNWRAGNQTAKSITGDVAFSSEKLAINFSSFWIAQIRFLKPAEVAAVFDSASGATGNGDLYRVKIPGDKRFLHKNTLCGGEDVQWVAAYAAGRELQLAFFSGSAMPQFTPDTMANAGNLCGTFAYVR